MQVVHAVIEEERSAEFRASLEAAPERIPCWPFDERGFPAVASGWKKTYRRGRQAKEAAYDRPTVECFHEWGKRASSADVIPEQMLAGV